MSVAFNHCGTICSQSTSISGGGGQWRRRRLIAAVGRRPLTGRRICVGTGRASRPVHFEGPSPPMLQTNDDSHWDCTGGVRDRLRSSSIDDMPKSLFTVDSLILKPSPPRLSSVDAESKLKRKVDLAYGSEFMRAAAYGEFLRHFCCEPRQRRTNSPAIDYGLMMRPHSDSFEPWTPSLQSNASSSSSSCCLLCHPGSIDFQLSHSIERQPFQVRDPERCGDALPGSVLRTLLPETELAAARIPAPKLSQIPLKSPAAKMLGMVTSGGENVSRKKSTSEDGSSEGNCQKSSPEPVEKLSENQRDSAIGRTN